MPIESAHHQGAEAQPQGDDHGPNSAPPAATSPSTTSTSSATPSSASAASASGTSHYFTMNPKFEAEEIKVFGEMYKKGYIYKGKKPVYWCPHDETALAEAEIEYAEDPCKSIYVKFRVKDDQGKLSKYCALDNLYFLIWTTTTWTHPRQPRYLPERRLRLRPGQGPERRGLHHRQGAHGARRRDRRRRELRGSRRDEGRGVRVHDRHPSAYRPRQRHYPRRPRHARRRHRLRPHRSRPRPGGLRDLPQVRRRGQGPHRHDRPPSTTAAS